MPRQCPPSPGPRGGRSGRYGKVGKAISIVCGEDEKHNLDILKDKYDITMKQFEFTC